LYRTDGHQCADDSGSRRQAAHPNRKGINPSFLEKGADHYSLRITAAIYRQR